MDNSFAARDVKLSWQEVLIKCVQASCGKFALQLRITLQVSYFKLDVAGQIRGIHSEWRANNLGDRFQFIKNLKPLLKIP